MRNSDWSSDVCSSDLVGPVVEHHHVVAIRGVAIRAGRLNHQRAVQRVLLLETRVRVIPIGTALAQLELVEKALTGGNAGKTEAGHAVHLKRQDDAVPMDGRRHAQTDRKSTRLNSSH